MRLLSWIWAALWLAWLAFILFIVTYPLDKFDGRPHWDSIRWIPFRDFETLFETSANVLLFLPLGYLTIRAWARFTDYPIVTACLLSFFFSACAEFYQIFCHDRVPTTTDIIMNVTGGALGGYMALLISWHKIRDLRGDEVKKAAADVLQA